MKTSIINDYINEIEDRLTSLPSREYYFPHKIYRYYELEEDKLDAIIDLLDELKEFINE